MARPGVRDKGKRDEAVEQKQNTRICCGFHRPSSYTTLDKSFHNSPGSLYTHINLFALKALSGPRDALTASPLRPIIRRLSGPPRLRTGRWDPSCSHMKSTPPLVFRRPTFGSPYPFPTTLLYLTRMPLLRQWRISTSISSRLSSPSASSFAICQGEGIDSRSSHGTPLCE